MGPPLNGGNDNLSRELEGGREGEREEDGESGGCGGGGAAKGYCAQGGEG